jgi:hypothetical protein
MNSISGSNVGAAFASGQLGLQNASNGITQAASNIAARTAESSQSVPREATAAASSSPQNATSGSTPGTVPGNITDDLISLNVNSINAQASAKVLDTANDMLGTIIDTIA